MATLFINSGDPFVRTSPHFARKDIPSYCLKIVKSILLFKGSLLIDAVLAIFSSAYVTS